MAPINWPAAYAAAHDLWLDACHAQAGMPKGPGAAEGPAEAARRLARAAINTHRKADTR